LARQFRIEESELRGRLNELRRKTRTPASTNVDTLAPVIKLSPKESELIEILLLHPELAETAVEEIPLDCLSDGAAREILGTFRKLHEAGEPTEFNRVMTLLDNARLKNLLVDLDERAREKAEQVQEDAPIRLRGLIEAYAQEESKHQRRETLASLEENGLDEQEALDVLQQLIEQERNRQGISVPTDG